MDNILLMMYIIIILLEVILTIEVICHIFVSGKVFSRYLMGIVKPNLLHTILIYMIVFYFFLDFNNDNKWFGSALQRGILFNTLLLCSYTVECNKKIECR